MLDPELLERITARRTELEEIEERLAKELVEVRAERDELAVAERSLNGCPGSSPRNTPRTCRRPGR